MHFLSQQYLLPLLLLASSHIATSSPVPAAQLISNDQSGPASNSSSNLGDAGWGTYENNRYVLAAQQGAAEQAAEEQAAAEKAAPAASAAPDPPVADPARVDPVGLVDG